MDYVGYTKRHLHQRVVEHSSLNSSIGKHMRDTHGMSKPKFINNFSVLKKCRNKFDCLIHKMLIIQDLKPTLDVQTDSICASYLHDHKETKCLLWFSLIYIQTMMKQSLCLDNDGSIIETSDSISLKSGRFM